jgi:rhamnose utilization protein RhaD (predicted bifunctional aldolase and dehydrogenase)/NAD(P)-dependent dehydrogenase (short-subunit alcohol dehydrogenase family)
VNEFPKITKDTDPLDALVAVSRFYGSDPTIVLAGGGNTSVKLGNVLHVKASGTSLATIEKTGFALLDRPQLDAIASAEYGTDVEMREAKYKAALLASRLEPERNQRPSVEALLHHLIPDKFVVHSHATVVNTVTCHARGPQLTKELFGDSVLWLPYIDPGYTLARALKHAMAEHKKTTGKFPKAIFMANHGLIVSSDDPNEIYKTTNELIDKITAKLGDNWQISMSTPKKHDNPVAAINTIAPALRGLLAEGANLKVVTFDDSDVALSFVNSPAARTATANGPLNPDQIVYCNSYPMWFDLVAEEKPEATIQRLRTALAEHQTKTGYAAKVVLVGGLGLFAIGDDYNGADTTRNLYLDSIKVMSGATRLGGINHLPNAARQFIESWEVEAYRKQIAKGAAKGGRVAGKIAVVTGAAQGFGLEIAQGFAAEGGHVALTDVNEAGAAKAALGICDVRGKGKAIGLAINVTNSESIAACVHQVVRKYGGFDVLISNAGVLKAESVKSQSEKDFDFVTAVNYKGYFFVTQKTAPILAIQRKARPDYMSDIIQINSKSGLQGSNKNGAYAGSKFGGIGLTQSFALELIEDGIKVNSICPGNFFDGPLWSDPNTGLFVQYLRTGKVPGAKTIEDVKKFYEAKVPMGRGCTTPDVMKAIFYLIDQQYETGQAVPVTGGQVMLS